MNQISIPSASLFCQPREQLQFSRWCGSDYLEGDYDGQNGNDDDDAADPVFFGDD